MSWEHLVAVRSLDWPTGNKQVGRLKVLRVLLYYCELAADDSGEAWPSQAAVADATGLHLRDVQNAQKVLLEQDFLLFVKPYRIHHSGTTYQVLPNFLPNQSLKKGDPRKELMLEIHGETDGALHGHEHGGSHGDVPCTTEQQINRDNYEVIPQSPTVARNAPAIAMAVANAIKSKSEEVRLLTKDEADHLFDLMVENLNLRTTGFESEEELNALALLLLQ